MIIHKSNIFKDWYYNAKLVKKAYYNGKVMWHRLPTSEEPTPPPESAYTKVEYVQSANGGVISFNYTPETNCEVIADVGNIILNYETKLIFTTQDSQYAYTIQCEKGTESLLTYGLNENGMFYYILHSNLDGRHTFSLGNKLMVDGENGTYSTNAGESATSSLCLKNNTGIKYYGLTINKPNGTSIVLKPYLVNNKAVLYDETNDMVYAPTSGDWIAGNPIS